VLYNEMGGRLWTTSAGVSYSSERHDVTVAIEPVTVCAALVFSYSTGNVKGESESECTILQRVGTSQDSRNCKIKARVGEDELHREVASRVTGIA
jgi:hypothetical protein